MATSGPVLRAHLSALAALGDDALGLDLVALDLAGFNHPQAEPLEYVIHLDALADRLMDMADDYRSRASDRVHSLTRMMTGVYGYGPEDDEDDDAPETDLIETIETRRGSGETLGIIALEAMRRAGWQAEALNFAPRFLIRLTDEDGERVIADPLSGWRPVEAHHMRDWVKAHYGLGAELTPDQYERLSNRAVLLRLQSAVKIRHLKAGRLARALGVVENTLLFAPQFQSLWREAAVLHARLNHYPQAVAALEQFLARCQDRAQRIKAQQMLADLRQHLN